MDILKKSTDLKTFKLLKCQINSSFMQTIPVYINILTLKNTKKNYPLNKMSTVFLQPRMF